MASIKFNNLAKPKNADIASTSYTYVDIHLDLEYDKVANVGVDAQDLNRDLRVSPDEFAIRNSLINLFNTRPGQRILLPKYGVNLDGYLFEPITKMSAEVLGDTLLQAIQTWEPRVTVKKIKVIAEPDNHQYSLVIIVEIPSLRYKSATLFGTISNEGFTETNNSAFI